MKYPKELAPQKAQGTIEFPSKEEWERATRREPRGWGAATEDRRITSLDLAAAEYFKVAATAYASGDYAKAQQFAEATLQRDPEWEEANRMLRDARTLAEFSARE